MSRQNRLLRVSIDGTSSSEVEPGPATQRSITPSILSETPYQRPSSSSSEESSSSIFYEDGSIRVERLLYKFALTLVPSFLQRYAGALPQEPKKLHAIAALDGLRGWACLLVFNFHFLFTYTWKVAEGWGFAHDNWGIHQLPIIHMLISGHVMVAIFFVISGYVITQKPLRTIRSKSWERSLVVLSSSTFRRALRLYIPSLTGIFLVFVAVRLGCYNYSHHVLKSGTTILGTNEQHPPVMRTFRAQFWDWYYTVIRLMDPFNWGLYYNNYNPHLWTIPVEFRSSLVLFTTMLATSRLRTRVRIFLVVFLIWFCTRVDRWDVVLFLCGMLMSEIDIITGLWDGPSLDEKPRSRGVLSDFMRQYGRSFWIAMFVLGLYIGSSPNQGVKWTPGYGWLARLTPRTYNEPHRFPQTIGAVIIVCSINHSKDVQKLFTNSLSQYLGKISFAFYIVHGPILHSLGYSIMPSIWRFTGKETNLQYCTGFLIGWLTCFPIALWAGDLFWRLVDIPSVNFAHWIEKRLVDESRAQSVRS
ncbi:putative acyltransferase [Paecilomyces variotii]|uniref:Putative acyltransferase n=1 Tax=Byssochlamys spectabilis TaxID=264951 RepID=A0A443I2S4_BYSSP|nr:putative acyltransferase [Paecilomyces variotii]KAJ9247541.1 hypothetical protein DTO207G8_8007 [Paecilomyces variotii]KAJ9267374.1 hypothetical protein DTO195F2_607 [Paecilomyces variotii]KAJ9360955.1 hypothetical protein DTO280E4_4166 [Paecilomyces variotii]KAJ9390681.1 hypothetical protein DTO063F5_1631 [Paecilomyces variotii]RWQ98357.1 putative acyltransferase [Paecilomyces variotii]